MQVLEIDARQRVVFERCEPRVNEAVTQAAVRGLGGIVAVT